MMNAVVTGASSGIGKSIAERLIKLDYTVYGISRDPIKSGITDPRFIPVPCDLTRLHELTGAAETILEKSPEINCLVNCAGTGFFAPHEELNPQKIHELTTLDLEAPLQLTALFLRSIKKNRGWIINISSITAKKSSPMGSAYSAVKAGLSHFGESLFEEIRKTGAKVLTLHPDITKTPFYRDKNFRESAEPESYILPECVADAIEFALTRREGTVLTEMTVRPQIHRLEKVPNRSAKEAKSI